MAIAARATIRGCGSSGSQSPGPGAQLGVAAGATTGSPSRATISGCRGIWPSSTRSAAAIRGGLIGTRFVDTIRPELRRAREAPARIGKPAISRVRARREPALHQLGCGAALGVRHIGGFGPTRFGEDTELWARIASEMRSRRRTAPRDLRPRTAGSSTPPRPLRDLPLASSAAVAARRRWRPPLPRIATGRGGARSTPISAAIALRLALRRWRRTSPRSGACAPSIGAGRCSVTPDHGRVVPSRPAAKAPALMRAQSSLADWAWLRRPAAGLDSAFVPPRAIIYPTR